MQRQIRQIPAKEKFTIAEIEMISNIQGGRTICELSLLLVNLPAKREHGSRLIRIQKIEGSHRKVG